MRTVEVTAQHGVFATQEQLAHSPTLLCAAPSPRLHTCSKQSEETYWFAVMLVSYAIFSALLGSQSVLFGKSISVILRTTITESNQVGGPGGWLCREGGCLAAVRFKYLQHQSAVRPCS